MPQYTFVCLTCGEVFDSIEKTGTKYSFCPKCKNVGKREKIELPSPTKKFGDRKF